MGTKTKTLRNAQGKAPKQNFAEIKGHVVAISEIAIAIPLDNMLLIRMKCGNILIISDITQKEYAEFTKQLLCS